MLLRGCPAGLVRLTRRLISDACSNRNNKLHSPVCAPMLRDEVRQSWHTAFPLPWCALFTLKEFLGRTAPEWPWQQVTGIISMLTPIPPTLRYGCNIRDVVNVWAWRNPFLLDARSRFLKDSTSKMKRTEMTHTVVPRVQSLQLKCHVDRFKTGYEPCSFVFITEGRTLKGSNNGKLW